MNQKVRRQLKRLYRYLLHITSFGLARASMRAGVYNVAGVPLRQNGSGLDVKEPEAENIMLSHFAIFDRVIGSLQTGSAACGKAVFLYEFHCAPKIFSKRLAVNNPSKHPDRKVERSQKKGFDVLRVTLNLARGNIETSAVQPALAESLPVRLVPASSTI